MGKVDEFEDFHPLTRDEWREWLAANHESADGVWFVYFKKHTGKARLGYEETVEEALCFGWIDGLARGVDGERSKLLFTPRKRKSVWSQPNKERIERLIASGRMTEKGLAKVEAAKADGSWDALNSSDNLEIPPDLGVEFELNQIAAANFGSFAKSVKKAILYWLGTAKRPETRAARIEKIVSMAERNKRANFDSED